MLKLDSEWAIIGTERNYTENEKNSFEAEILSDAFPTIALIYILHFINTYHQLRKRQYKKIKHVQTTIREI